MTEQTPEMFDNEFAQSRLGKRHKLLAEGVPLYPHRFERTHASAVVKDGYPANEGQTVGVAGRVMLLRLMGKASFATLRDERGDIQVYLKMDEIGEAAYLRVKTELDLGDIIGVTGTVFKTKMGEITVKASSWTFLSKAILPPPEKWHGLKDLETRYRKRYVDLFVNPDVRELFAKRAKLIESIRAFYVADGFVEVETPAMASLAGGAAAKPFATHHNALDLELFLRVAPELYLKRLIVGGFDKVFEIGKNFRNEGISTRHNPEFTMLESYQAYVGADEVMAFTERLLRHACRAIHGTESFTVEGRAIDLARPFPRVAFLDAVSQALGVAVTVNEPSFTQLRELAKQKGVTVKDIETRDDLLDEIFGTLIEPALQDPTFVVRYPRTMSPLAKACADDPSLADRFELIIMGREVANAYSEQNDPVEQLEKFREQVGGDDSRLDMDYVEALAYGMPPAGGLGVGIDRLVMLLCNLSSIRDAILFPLLRPQA